MFLIECHLQNVQLFFVSGLKINYTQKNGYI